MKPCTTKAWHLLRAGGVELLPGRKEPLERERRQPRDVLHLSAPPAIMRKEGPGGRAVTSAVNVDKRCDFSKFARLQLDFHDYYMDSSGD